MTIVEIFNRVQMMTQLCKQAAALKAYDPIPFSSLTARSDYAINDRFAPKPKNEYTKQEQALIEGLLANMSKSRARIVDARKRARTSVASLPSSGRM